MASAVGTLSAAVWPTHVGLAESNDGVVLHEPYDKGDYSRGRILWEANSGDVLGHGRVSVPKGIYTHVVFAGGPTDSFLGAEKMEHPLVHDRPGIVDVSPIRNQQVLPRNGKV